MASFKNETIYDDDGRKYIPIRDLDDDSYLPRGDKTGYCLLVVATRDISHLNDIIKKYHQNKFKSRERARSKKDIDEESSKTRVVLDHLEQLYIVNPPMPMKEAQAMFETSKRTIKRVEKINKKIQKKKSDEEESEDEESSSESE